MIKRTITVKILMVYTPPFEQPFPWLLPFFEDIAVREGKKAHILLAFFLDVI